MSLRRRQQSLTLPMRVWDLPTRLFHWLVVLLIPASYVTAKTHHLGVHMALGYAMLALLLFRLVWGVVGSQTSRFTSFLGNPVAGLRHLARLGEREPDAEIGHNAAGGWFVLVLLVLLVVQVASGLSAHDNIGLNEGPLAKHVGTAASDLLSAAHVINFKVIFAAIGLHLLAIAAYAMLKRQNLTWAMITGKKRLPATTPAPRMASPLLAVGIMAVAAAVAWVVATQL
jgi:cytochrome b